MKTGLYSNAGASLRLAYNMQVAPHLRGGLRELTHLVCEPGRRKEGHASALMHSVCKEADAANVTLILNPKPFGTAVLDASQLEDWYARRFGFYKLQERPAVLMVRLPYAVQPMPAFVPRPVEIAVGAACG